MATAHEEVVHVHGMEPCLHSNLTSSHRQVAASLTASSSHVEVVTPQAGVDTVGGTSDLQVATPGLEKPARQPVGTGAAYVATAAHAAASATAAPRSDRGGDQEGLGRNGSLSLTAVANADGQEQDDASAQVLAPAGAAAGGQLEYTVKENDTVRSIAAYFDITPSRLKKFNRMSSDFIYPGQVIMIPQGSGDMPVVSAAAATASGVGAVKKSATKMQKEYGLLPVTVALSESEEAALDEQCLEMFVKVPACHMTDSHGIVPGTLLVTPNGIMFDPDLSSDAIRDNGIPPESVFATMKMISSATVYRDASAVSAAAARASVPSPAQPHPLAGPHQEIPPELLVHEQADAVASATPGLPPDSAATWTCSTDGSAAELSHADHLSKPVAAKNLAAPGLLDHQSRCHGAADAGGGVEVEQQLAAVDPSKAAGEGGGADAQVAPAGRAECESCTQAGASVPATTAAAVAAGAPVVVIAGAGVTAEAAPGTEQGVVVVRRTDLETSRSTAAAAAGRLAGDAARLAAPSEQSPHDAGASPLMPHAGTTATLAPASETLYLCLRASVSTDNSSSFTTDNELYNQRKKPEHWFTLADAAKLENVYSFLLKWKPDTGECHHNLYSLSSVAPNVPSSMPAWQQPLLEMVLSVGSSKSPQKKHLILRKEWEVTSSAEVRVTSMLMDAEKDLPVPPSNVPSSFLTEAQRRQLAQALPYRIEGNEWHLVYSTELHGFSLSQMYIRMRNLEDSPILLVLQDTSGMVFGALTSCLLAVSDHFYGTGESFLFTFADRFRVYPWTGENNLFIRSSLDNLWIGTGKGTFGLFLDGDLCKGRTQHCKTYNNDPLTGAGEDFVLKHLEAWCFFS